MKHYYVTHIDVWQGKHDFGDGRLGKRFNLFPRGSHGFHLRNGLLLLSVDFDESQPLHRSHQQIWHGHPEVARLHHPTLSADEPISHLHTLPRWAHKQFKPHHYDALRHMLKIEDHHTVWDVHQRAKQIHPLVILDENTY